MARSKHFRKDVIIARVIFAGICVVIILIIALVVSLVAGSSHGNADTQHSESQQVETSESTQQINESEEDVTVESEFESETEEVIYYVVTDTEVRFRSQPDTGSTTIEKLPAGTKTVLLEELEGWYYVEYNGEYGYISADYSEIVEGN